MGVAVSTLDTAEDMRQPNRLVRKTWALLRRRGVGYLGYLLTGFLLPKLAYHLLYEVRRSRLRRLWPRRVYSA
jgi:hypothetical protein